MSTLKIENFGPIKLADIQTNKVTVLIGPQGSGKSTVAKLIASFSEFEKNDIRYSNSDIRMLEINRRFIKSFEYHRIDEYLNDDTLLIYQNYFRIEYRKGKLTIGRVGDEYTLPKITYYPAERNFVSSIKKSKEWVSFKLWSQSLQEFKEIFQEAKESIQGSMKLPINNAEIEYNRLNDILFLKGENFKIPLYNSASGFQSFVPMYVVADYVAKMVDSENEMDDRERDYFIKESAKILQNKDYTQEQKDILLSNLAGKTNIKRTLNIIEEPEQNLFPDSQRKMLNALLEYNNAAADNSMIITTHSPYIVNYLMLAIKASEIEKETTNQELKSRIYGIVPQKALTPLQDVTIYQLSEDGHINHLGESYGMPSNDNYLNNQLGEDNMCFSELMEIEELCQQ